jgi:4'-phosphopantetheinyl transferase
MTAAIIQLYRIPLNAPEFTVERLARLLSPDERFRAGRFEFAADARRFTVARAAMRTILGSQLNLAPERVRFRYGEYGKPALAEGCAGADLRFNLSDSGEWALLGVARGLELGVDIEALRPIPEMTAIADRFFAPSEAEWLRALPLAEQPWNFHRIWTCKEAYLKAVGAGLSLDTRAFRFDFTVKPAQLLTDREWTIQEFQPMPAYTGAVCAEGTGWTLSWQDWRV